jgi:hypothetical protein
VGICVRRPRERGIPKKGEGHDDPILRFTVTSPQKVGICAIVDGSIVGKDNIDCTVYSNDRVLESPLRISMGPTCSG